MRLSGSVKLRLCCVVWSGLLGIGRLRLSTRFLFSRALLLLFAFGQLLFYFFVLALGLLFCGLFKRQLGLADLLQPALTPL